MAIVVRKPATTLLCFRSRGGTVAVLGRRICTATKPMNKADMSVSSTMMYL